VRALYLADPFVGDGQILLPLEVTGRGFDQPLP